ncbi:MAG: hypothetical protein KF726_02140 [Anaerolineae bacterium]|nr:hypothetical protein [Anaerolineae bacterium]
MKAIDITGHEQIRLEHKVYNGHEGVDARMWVILKGESDYTPTQQGFWLPMDKADAVLKALEAEIAEPVDTEVDGYSADDRAAGAGAKLDR